VVAVDDPLLKGFVDSTRDLRADNVRWANLVGLPAVPLADVLICRRSNDCSLKDGIAATVSAGMGFLEADSAVVFVSTHFFRDDIDAKRPRGWPRWQLLAVYEVRLARRNRDWSVVSVSVRAES
jgi:hypothetical protein